MIDSATYTLRWTQALLRSHLNGGNVLRFENEIKLRRPPVVDGVASPIKLMCMLKLLIDGFPEVFFEI